MFPSNNPFDNYSQNLHGAASSFENPSPSPCFFNFPTSLLDDEELLIDHFLRQNQTLQLPTTTANTNTTSTTTTTTTTTTATTTTASVAPTEDGVTSHVHMNQNDEYPTNPTFNSAENTNLSGDDTLAANLNPSNPHQPTAGEAAAMKRKRGGGRIKQPRTGPPRRRAGKKDRHSKIHTAQGPRDRRMRLSLQIARKFFDLQDMLGFDKASKTIEWLFSKSKTAIKDLTATLPPQRSCTSLSSANTNSNCLVSSSTLTKDKVEEPNNSKVIARDDSEEDDADKMRAKKLSGTKASVASSKARESREKARARARLRTMEKKKQKELLSPPVEIDRNNDDEKNNNDNSNKFEKLGSSSTPESARSDPHEESGGAVHSHSYSHPPFYHQQQQMFEICTSQLSQQQSSSLENQMASVGIIEKLLGGGSSSVSSSSIYDDYGGYMGFPPNWPPGTDNTRSFSSDYGAISCMHDPAAMLLQQQNPNPAMFSAAMSSGLYLQSQYFDNQFSGSSSDAGLL